ncbi:MAG: small multi-drug export protein [Candidatus Aenigmatarchaeota archaeon]
MYEWLFVGAVSLSPIAELRASIPLGIILGLPPAILIPYAIAINCLAFFPIYFCLEILYERFLHRFGIIRKIVKKTHSRAAEKIKKWGELGLLLFVAIPLPGTGVWTATLIAWLFGLKWKQSFAVISLGAIIAGIIVSIITLGIVAL